MKYLLGSIGGLFLVSGSVFAISGGLLSKAQYLKVWNKKYYTHFKDPRLQLIAHGILAASGHNMQPWKVKLDKEVKERFYLYADRDFLTMQIDPYGRQTMVSQGTFLEYIDLAGRELGYSVNIQLFPKGEYQETELLESMEHFPVAKIDIKKKDKEKQKNYPYLFMQDTNRGAYSKKLLTEDQIERLIKLNTNSMIHLNFYQDKETVNQFKKLILEGVQIEAYIHRISKETANIFRSNEKEKNKKPYGLSVEGQGTKGLAKYFIQGLISLIPATNNESAASKRYVQSTQKSVEHTHTYGMIKTKGNNRREQIESGRLYSRLILEAHAYGLALQPMSFALQEYPEMKRLYQNIHHDFASPHETIQLLFRIGQPIKTYPLSMRKDIKQIIKG